MTPYNTDISATTRIMATCREYDTSDRYAYRRMLREYSPIRAMELWHAVNLVDSMRINRLIGR